MKKNIFMFLALLVGIMGGLTAQNDTPEQEKQKEEKKPSKFGSFLRKAGEVTTGINMSDETFIVNPNPTDFKVEFVKAYGDPSTGRVSIVFKVNPSLVGVTSASFGGSLFGTVAIDKNGKQYKPYGSVDETFDVSRGIWSEVVLTGREHAFDKVPPETTQMEIMKVYFYFSASVKGVMEIRNVPIDWNYQPTE